MSNGSFAIALLEAFKENRKALIPILLVLALFGFSVQGIYSVLKETGLVSTARAAEHGAILDYLEKLAATYERGLLIEAVDCWNRAPNDGAKQFCRDAYRGRQLPAFQDGE